jgi:predicted ATPase
VSHFILTGAPGAGKTIILRQLEVMGFAVVEEAATDVIALAQARGVAEPHREADFLDAITSLQERRRAATALAPAGLVFHDRSPICTLALAEFLGLPTPTVLVEALASIERSGFYDRRVLFVRNLGFIVNTAARRISFEDTLGFEQVHEATYRRLGYELVLIEPGGPVDRARRVIDVTAWPRP